MKKEDRGNVALEKIKTLVLDMDDTLYPKSLNIAEQFIKRAEDCFYRITKNDRSFTNYLLDLWKKDEEICLGLLREKGFSPEDIMNDICALDVSLVEYSPQLRQLLSKIKLRKIIYTNSSHGHVDDVLDKKLCIKDMFASANIYTSQEANWHFKHNPEAFHKFLEFYNLDAATTAMVEDNPAYLKSAKQLGIMTILVNETGNKADLPFVDYEFENVIQVLKLFATFQMS